MKIGIDVREFQSGQMTGIGRYLWHFLQYATTSNYPHEYVLFCNQETLVPFDLTILKMAIIREKITPLWDQILLPLNIAKEKIDVFLTPYIKAPFFLLSNMILIINDLIPLFFPEEHGLFKRLYFRFMSGRSARRAKLFTFEKMTNRILNVFESVLNQKIFLPEVFQWNM